MYVLVGLLCVQYVMLILCPEMGIVWNFPFAFIYVLDFVSFYFHLTPLEF